MKIINSDLTTVTSGIVGHQCNCMGVMGGGVALAIRNTWPKAYHDYIHAYRQHRLFPGNAVISQLSIDLYVVHLCGQNDFGSDKVYTNYGALSNALTKMKEFGDSLDGDVPKYLPYGIGCGLAGGDWKKVESIIDSIIPEVVLCKI